MCRIHRANVVFILYLILSLALPSFGNGFQSPDMGNPFVAVFVDDATEKTLGPFPYDRSIYARALEALRKAGTKAVILKYFLDQSKPGPGDDQLAAEIKERPVLLQACFDLKENNPNPLPDRFNRADQIQGDGRSLLSGVSGWIPLEKFSRNCAGIGFVDIRSAQVPLQVPMAVRYQKSVFPSLELAAVELAFGRKSEIQLGQSISLAGHSLPLNPFSEVSVQLPAADKLDFISFLDVLDGKFDPNRVKGKIVVVGFDAQETPTLATPLGPLRIHRLFFYSLVSLYQQLAAH